MAVKVITPTRKVERVRPPAPPPEERVPFEPVEEPVKAVPIEPIKEPTAPLPVRPIEETHQRPGAGDMWIRKEDYEGLTVAQRGVYDKGGWKALKVEIKAEAKREAERRAEEARPKPWGYYGSVSQSSWHFVKGKWREQKKWFALDKDGNVIKDVFKTRRTDIGRERLAQAKAAREAERKAGKTIHSIASHLGRLEATTMGGKLYSDMTPIEKDIYNKLRKAGASVPEASAVASMGMGGIYRGTHATWTITDKGVVRKVTPQDIKAQAGKPDFVPEGATKDTQRRYGRAGLGFTHTLPVKEVKGKWVYDLDKIADDPALLKLYGREVKGAAPTIKAYTKAQKAREVWKGEITAGGIEVTVEGEKRLVSAADANKIKKETPDLHKILVARGWAAYIVAFNAKQFEQRQALKRLAKYKVNGSYDTAQAQADGISVGTLAMAGFTTAQISAQKDTVAYLQSSPSGKFAILQKQGLIPKDAEFDKLDKEGNVLYTVGAAPLVDFPSGATQKDYEKWIVELGASDKVTPLKRPPGVTDAYMAQYITEMREGVKNTLIGLTPVYGTVYFWKDMSPTWQAVSIAGDLLFLSLLARPFVTAGTMTKVFALGSKSGTEATILRRILNQGVKQSRATLRGIDPKLVKPFNKLIKTRANYADNLAQIKINEKLLTISRGEVAPEIRRSLGMMRSRTAQLQEALRLAGEDFASAQRLAIKRIKVTPATKLRGVAGKTVTRPGYDATTLLKDNFASEIVRDTKRLVGLQFEKIPSVSRLNGLILRTVRDIEATKKALAKAMLAMERMKQTRRTVQAYTAATKSIDYLGRKLSDLNRELVTLKAQKVVAGSGKARGLATQLTAIRAKLQAAKNELQKTLVEWRQKPLAEKDYEGIIRQHRQIIARLTKQEASIADKYVKSLKGLEIEWAEELRRGGGGGNVMVSPGKLGLKPPPMVGGGKIGAAEEAHIATLAYMGMKAVAWGDDWVEYSYTPKVIEVPGKETIQVEPEPYWAGEVKVAPAPAREPEVEPMPGITPAREPTPAERPPEYPKTYPFMPMPEPMVLPITPKPGFDPTPGVITWTPSVVLVPKVKAGEAVVIEASPELETQAQVVAVFTKAMVQYKSLIATGTSPGEAIRIVAKAFPSVMITPITKTEITTKITTQTRIANQVQIRTQTGTQTLPATELLTVPITKTEITPTVGKVPPPEKVKPPPPAKPPAPTSDKAKRKLISEGKGAFAFRMGELGKERDVWYAYISPYNKPEHRIVVVGKAPRGALIVRGPGSAIKTAQMLYGKAIAERRTDDIGFMDAIFKPMLRRKGIRLSFKPDPEGETIGNFGTPFRITKAEPISSRAGSITDRRASISSGRGIRITPKVGKLR